LNRNRTSFHISHSTSAKISNFSEQKAEPEYQDSQLPIMATWTDEGIGYTLAILHLEAIAYIPVELDVKLDVMLWEIHFGKVTHRCWSLDHLRNNISSDYFPF
jgi:hypothetical protein